MAVNFTALFLEALLANKGRGLLRTSLGTEALQEIPAKLRKQVFFSAGVAVADLLEEWYRLITDMVEANTDRATARLAIKQQLAELGYVPAEGKAGGLLDLSSNRRINLILDTQVEIVNGWGRFAQENTEAVVQANPARELYRAITTKQPRNWESLANGKWSLAGGSFPGGRMIARVDDPIWTKGLGEGGFNRFGIPTGPFDFNSGMRTRPIGFQEAEALGVLKPGDKLPEPEDFELKNEIHRPHMSQAMKDAVLKAGIGEFDAEGVLRPAA